MKKIIAGFIVVSMVMLLLAGSFTPMASVKGNTVDNHTRNTFKGVSFPSQEPPNSVTVKVATIPASSQVFNFTITGGLKPATFSLTNATLSNTRVFNNVTPGTYIITLQPVKGYALAGVFYGDITEGRSDKEQHQFDLDHFQINWRSITNRKDQVTFQMISKGEYAFVFCYLPTHTITFDAMGGTPTPAPIKGVYSFNGINFSFNPDEPIRATAPTKDSFIFKDWNTKADGTGTTFDASTTPVLADITVYATYIPLYTVTFDAMGGTPTPAPIKGVISYNGINYSLNTQKPIIFPSAPTKAGFSFTNWNTKADGTGTTFTAATKVIADITVYASYKALPPVFVPGYWYFWNIPGFMKSTTFHFPTSILQWQNSTILFLGGTK